MNVRVVGRNGKYKVMEVLGDGTLREIKGVRAVTLNLTQDGHSEAVLYIPNPQVSVEAARAADGVRAG